MTRYIWFVYYIVIFFDADEYTFLRNDMKRKLLFSRYMKEMFYANNIGKIFFFIGIFGKIG